MRPSDIIPPNGPYKHVTVLLGPSELAKPTKSGQFDEAIALDDVEMPWLGDLMMRTSSHAQADSVWSFKMPELVEQFETLAVRLGLSFVSPCLYLLRHGGASHDTYLRKRSIEQTQRRGRWLVASSMRRYEKHGRVRQVLGRAPKATVEFGQQVKDCFPDLFSGKLKLGPPITRKGRDKAVFASFFSRRLVGAAAQSRP